MFQSPTLRCGHRLCFALGFPFKRVALIYWGINFIGLILFSRLGESSLVAIETLRYDADNEVMEASKKPGIYRYFFYFFFGSEIIVSLLVINFKSPLILEVPFYQPKDSAKALNRKLNTTFHVPSIFLHGFFIIILLSLTVGYYSNILINIISI